MMCFKDYAKRYVNTRTGSLARARSLVVNDLRSGTKGFRFELGY